MLNIGIVGGPGMLNGFNAMIMQSQQDTDKVIRELEVAVEAGYNPNIAFSQVLERCGVRERDLTDLTDFDRQRLKRKVEQISKHKSLGR